MSSVGGNNWEAQIPAQTANTQIFYYVHGEANSGKKQGRPIAAPSGYWSFKVLGPNGIENVMAGVSMEDIFPNPTSTIACVSINYTGNLNDRIAVLDMFGERSSAYP